MAYMPDIEMKIVKIYEVRVSATGEVLGMFELIESLGDGIMRLQNSQKESGEFLLVKIASVSGGEWPMTGIVLSCPPYPSGLFKKLFSPEKETSRCQKEERRAEVQNTKREE